MSKLICITNRHLVTGDFLARIEAVAKAKPFAIMLREKDLAESAYRTLAEQVMAICKTYNVNFICHRFYHTAQVLHAEALHMPLPLLRQMTPEEKTPFKHLGASCHSVEDAQEALALGATYITLGHIYPTACKKGVPPRGLALLSEVASQVSLPVYAIGGINPDRFGEVLQAGAQGACIMSSAMEATDLKQLINGFHQPVK